MPASSARTGALGSSSRQDLTPGLGAQMSLLRRSRGRNWPGSEPVNARNSRKVYNFLASAGRKKQASVRRYCVKAGRGTSQIRTNDQVNVKF